MRPSTRSSKPPENRNDLKTIRTLLPYLWEFKGRVIIAILLLIIAKVANVAVPLVLKDIVDALDQPRAMLALPVLLLLAYGVLRFASTLFGELRDALCPGAVAHQPYPGLFCSCPITRGGFLDPKFCGGGSFGEVFPAS